MTFDEAKHILQSRYPSRIIKAGGDYDDNHFVFSAVNPKEIDARNVGQYFAVEKDTGNIKYYIPENLMALVDCFNKGGE